MTRVVLVDDHALFRAGVRSELDGLVDVVGDAATVAEAVALIRETAPDVVLLDVHMPDGGGLEVLRQIGADAPATQFLALSVSDAAEDVIAVIRAGARGYVTKTISGADLADAVRRVHGGDAVFSPRLAGFVLDAFAGAAPARPGRPSRPPTRPTSTSSRRASARSCSTSRAATCTRRSPSGWASPRRPSRPTCRRCCASCSSPAATSCRAGRRRGGCWIERRWREGPGPALARAIANDIFDGVSLVWRWRPGPACGGGWREAVRSEQKPADAPAGWAVARRDCGVSNSSRPARVVRHTPVAAGRSDGGVSSSPRSPSPIRHTPTAFPAARRAGPPRSWHRWGAIRPKLAIAPAARRAARSRERRPRRQSRRSPTTPPTPPPEPTRPRRAGVDSAP